ncbi:MAG: hypothetical protein ACM3IJ_00875 [Candidatus Levyibacteriota bacterium]
MKRLLKKNISLIYFVIILCLVIFLSFLFTANQLKKTAQTPKAVPTPTLAQEQPTMILAFNPNIITVNASGSFSAKLSVDSYGNPFAGVTLKLTYNPAQIKNVKLIAYEDPTSALSNALVNTYSYEDAGTITTVFAIPSNVPEQKGKGMIATVSGTLAPGIPASTIDITSSTAVSRSVSRVVLGKINLEVKR